jgi:GntR family transcriptional repressor for pyruvate dehydrogenase complex
MSKSASERGLFAIPVRAARAFEIAVENIIDGIEQWGLSVGDTLPTETVLAQQLQVSRPTVRQALHLLRDSGLVSLRRGGGGGVFVESPVIPAFSVSTDRIGPADIAEALIARRALETAVTLHATTTATDADLAELDRINDLLRANLGNSAAAAGINLMFHRAVARATHNKYLLRNVHEINRLLEPVREAYPAPPEEDRRTLDIHEQQAAAMRSRDVGAVTQVVDMHFRALEDDVARRRGVSRKELLSAARDALVDAS